MNRYIKLLLNICGFVVSFILLWKGIVLKILLEKMNLRVATYQSKILLFILTHDIKISSSSIAEYMMFLGFMGTILFLGEITLQVTLLKRRGK